MGWTADCAAHRALHPQGRPRGVQAPTGEAQAASGAVRPSRHPVVLSVPERVPGEGRRASWETWRDSALGCERASPQRPPLGALAQGKRAGHSQGLVPQRLQLVPVLLAELLGPLGCVHGARLARHGAFHDLPGTGRPAVLRAAPSPWMAGIGGSHWGLPLPGGNGAAASPDPKLISVSSDTSPRAHWTPAPALLRGDRKSVV